MRTRTLARSMTMIALCVLFALTSRTSMVGTAQLSTNNQVDTIGRNSAPAPSNLARSLPAIPKLPVAMDASFQPIAPFSDVSVSDLSVAELSKTKFVIAYRANLGGVQGTVGAARVGQVLNGIIVYGPLVIFNSGITTAISTATLSSGQFVITYRDHSNSDYGTAIIGNVSGDTISFGSEYIFNYAATYETSVTFQNTGAFVIAFQDTGNSSHGKVVIGTHDWSTSGQVITYYSKYTFNAEATSSISISWLFTSPNFFIVAYRNASNSGRLKRGMINFSDHSVEYGDIVLLNGQTADISVAGLTATEAVVVYRDEGNFNYGTARIINTNTTPVTFGDEYIFCNESTSLATNFSVARLSDTSFMVGYFDASADGRIITGATNSSLQVTYGSQLSYNPGNISYRPVVGSLVGQLVCWSDLSDSSIGKCRLYGDWMQTYLPLLLR